MCTGVSPPTLPYFVTDTFQLDDFFFKAPCKVVLSSPFALELVIHSIIDTSCQERWPAVKSPADGGQRA